MARFILVKDITLRRAQTAAFLITIAYIVMISFSIQYTDVFRPEFLIWYTVAYTCVFFFVIVIAIAEAYFQSHSLNQQKVTRYLVASFWLVFSLEAIYGTALNVGLIPLTIPRINAPPLAIVVAINLTMTLALWTTYFKMKGATVMGTYISISGVTSSSVNIDSPFATALTNLDATGKTEMALTLLQLRDVVQEAKFADAIQQRQALEILESLSEEAQKPQSKKLSAMAMISSLTSLVSSAATIGEKATVLLEKLKELWK